MNPALWTVDHKPGLQEPFVSQIWMPVGGWGVDIGCRLLQIALLKEQSSVQFQHLGSLCEQEALLDIKHLYIRSCTKICQQGTE